MKLYRRILTLDNLLMTLTVFVVLRFIPIIFTLDFLDPIQNTFQDFQVTDLVFSKLHDESKQPLDTNIVLVNVGNFNRKQIAEEINMINRYKPKVIGIDIRFIDDKGNEMDVPLADAFSRTSKLVLATKLDDPANDVDNSFRSIELPQEKFQRFAGLGFANLILSEKGFNTVRTFTPKAMLNGAIDLFFPVKVASLFNPEKTKKLLDRNNSQEIIDYRRNLGRYTAIDADEAISGSDKLKAVSGKIVLLGFLGPDLETNVTEDTFFTSMNPKFVGKTFPDMYGLVIHANVISMILDERYCTRTPYWLSVVFAFLICYFNLSLFMIMRERSDVLYEGVNFLLILSELVFFLIIILYVFYFFKFEISILADFFPILLCTVVFETYQDSLKPLWVEYFKKAKQLYHGKFTKNKQ